MSENILIGVGGTGAKVVEAALVLCAAGMGPSNLRVGFIDQDEDNGNVERARQFLDALLAFQDSWSGEGNAAFLDRTTAKEQGGSRFMHTRLSRLAAKPHDLWCPHPEGGDSRDKFVDIFRKGGLSPELQTLMDVLFLEEDQQLKLDKGYKGRPHIGSPAITAAMLDGDRTAPFWQQVTAAIQAARGGEETRIFIAGSVFGGTGAAGFPTLARVIRAFMKDRSAEGEARPPANVKIGGMLMLPYFSFPPPGAGQDSDVARDEELLLQSQAALDYYAGLFGRNEQLFDELYVVGWAPRIRLGYHEAGKKAQANPPLAPELVAATAVSRFLTSHSVGASESNPVFVCARTAEDSLGWDDLPGEEAYLRLGQLLRFASYWKYQLDPELDEKPGLLRPGRKGHPYFSTQKVNLVDFENDTVKAARTSLDAVNDHILRWAATLQAASVDGGVRKFSLWDLSPLGTGYDKTRPGAYSLRADTQGLDLEKAFNELIVTDRPESPLQDTLRGEIGTIPRPGNHRGLGTLVAATHHAARLHTREKG